MKHSVARLVARRGRPRKFNEPSRAVTLTLPESVIAVLDAVDHDLSRAVVRISQAEVAKRPCPPAELSIFGRRAVIVVNPTRALEERTGIFLVPLSDGRALISFDESISINGLELTLQDALEDARLSKEDSRIFKSILDLLKDARLSDAVELHQRNIIVLESTRQRQRRADSGSPKPRRVKR